MKTASNNLLTQFSTFIKNLKIDITKYFYNLWLMKSRNANVILIITFIMAGGLLITNAQPIKLWDKTYGTLGADKLVTVINTSDGGYLWAGTAGGIDGDRTSTNWGETDYWVIKTNSSGVKQWDASYGGNGPDDLKYAFPSIDGGFLLIGSSKSEISGNRSAPRIGGVSWDYWVVKINASGIIEWDKSFSSNGFRMGRPILSQPSHDGGYWIVWFGDCSTTEGIGSRFIKINQDGEIVSNKCIDLFISNFYYTNDGHFLVDNYGSGDEIIGISKLNTNLDVIWSVDHRELRGIRSFIEEPDGDYLLFSGDILQRGMVTRMNPANGSTRWSRYYTPFADFGRFTNAVKTGDDKILVLGSAWPRGLSDDPPLEHRDYWVVKMDFDGNKEWERTYGGVDSDYSRSVIKTGIDTYLLSGISNSPISGTKTQSSRGGYDFWSVKIKDIPATTITITTPEGLPASPSPDCQTLGIDDRPINCNWPLFLDDLRFPNFNLKVRFFNDPRFEIASVVFKINGQIMSIDNKAPFMLHTSEYLMKNKEHLTFKPGTYELEIIAFNKTGGKGNIVETLTGNLQVMNGKTWQKMEVIEEKNNSSISKSFRIVPIPGFNRFNIQEQALKGEKLLIRVYNYKGKEVYSAKALNSGKQWSFDTTNWNSGIYVVKLESNLQSVRSKKIIIK